MRQIPWFFVRASHSWFISTLNFLADYDQQAVLPAEKKKIYIVALHEMPRLTPCDAVTPGWKPSSGRSERTHRYDTGFDKTWWELYFGPPAGTPVLELRNISYNEPSVCISMTSLTLHLATLHPSRINTSHHSKKEQEKSNTQLSQCWTGATGLVFGQDQ